MFGIIWFLLVASVIALSLVWLLDNNGNVVITWLGYQIQADILPAILALILFSAIIFAFSFLLARLLSIKFPSLLKIIFRRNYTKQLEKIVRRHNQAFSEVVEMFLALEVADQKLAEESHKKISKLVKNAKFNNYLLAKIFFARHDYKKAAEVFERFSENKNAKILSLKSKLRFALSKNDNVSAVAYAEQILAIKTENLDIIKTIFSLYKKHNLHQEAEALVTKYGNLD